MALWFETGQITSPAGTGNQSYTFTGAGNGLVPKAIIFFASFIAAGSTGADDHKMFGFTTGSTAARNQCHCFQNQDGVGTLNAIVGFSETSCIFKNDDNATTTDLAAVLVSFDTDGFTLNWTTTAAGVNIQYIAIGGDAISVFADNFDTGTGTGNIGETGVGFQPKAVIFAWSKRSTTGTFASQDAGFGVGVATSATADWTWLSGCDDGALANEFYGELSDDACVKTITESTGAIESEFQLVSLDSDGFTIDPVDATGTSTTVSYLCLGGNIQVAAGTDTAPASATTKSTNVGFNPAMVMLAGFNTTAVNNGNMANLDRAMSLGFGVPSADSRSCFWVEDSGSDPIDCNAGASSTKCITIRSPTAVGTVSAEADIDASASNSFVLNWTTAGTQFIFGYLAIAEAATNLAPADLVQTVVLDNVPVLQNHVLISDGLTQLVALDNVSVLQNHVITSADLVQLVVLDTLTVSHFTPITPADLVQLVVLDNDTITVVYPKPTLVAIGTRATAVSSTTLSVPYPANIEANDYLVLYILDNPGSLDNPTTPDGWTLLSNADLGGTGEHFVYRKVADGTETGNLDVTVASDGQGQIGYITHYKGPAGCRWFEEFLSTSTGTDTTAEISSITASGPMRLGVSYLGIPQVNNSFGDVSGETGGTWAEQLDQATIGSVNATICLETANITTRTTISGGTSTIGTNRWTQTTWVIGCDVPEAMPYQAAAGAGATAESPATTIVVPYPAGIVAGDLLVTQIFRFSTSDNDPATPTDWTKKHEDDTTAAGQAQFIFYKIADGTETGSLTFTGLTSGVAGYFARMYRFVVDATSWGLEGGATTNGSNSASVSMPSLTTTAANRLGLSFFSSSGQNAPVSSTGESGGDWVEDLPDFSSAAGNDAVIQLQTADMESAGTISGGTFSDGGNDAWVARTFAIYGTVAATNITPQDLVQLVVIDPASITQNHVISAADLVQLVVLDNATIAQNHVLLPDGLVQVVTLDNVSLQLLFSLISSDLVQLVVLDNDTITQNHVTAPDGLTQLVFLDNDTLSQNHVLTSADLVQLVVLDSTALAVTHVLMPDGLVQLVVLDEVSLAALLSLTPQDLVQLVVLDNATITQAHVLSAADLVQLVVLDNTTLAQTHALASDNLAQLVTMEYCPVGAYFNGSTGWLEQNISGAGVPVPDGRSGSFAALFRLETDSGTRTIATGGQGAVSFRVQTDDTFRVALGGSGGNFTFQTTATIINDGEYHLILASWDTDHAIGNKLAHLVLDGVIDTVVVTVDNLPAFDIVYSQGDNWWTVAASILGTLKFRGDIAYVWFVEPYIDFSLESNIRKFIDAQGRPVPLGFDGSAPLGAQPALYVAGPYNNIQYNRGYIGGFPQFGSITASSADPVCGNPTYILQNHVLSSADLVQLVFLDDVTVVEVGSGNLIVADLVHAVVFDNTTLIQNHVLASGGLVQEVFLDNIALLQSHALSADDLVQIVVLDNATLAQLHAIAPANLVQLVFLDNATLLQNHILTSDGLVQLVVLDGTAFAQTHVLAASDLVQVVVLDNSTLSQNHVITSADLVQLVFLDNVDTGGTVSLSVGGLVQVVVLDPATISQNQLLTSNDLVQQVFLDNAPITQAHILGTADLAQEVFLDNDTLTQTHALTSDDLVQFVVLDEATLAQLHTLTTADLTQLVFLDNATLAQLSVLIADDLTQTVELDGNFITQVHAITADDLTQLVFLDDLTGTLFPGQAGVQPPVARIVVSGDPNTIIVATDTSPIVVFGGPRVAVVEGGKSRVYVFGGPRNFEVGSED